ncbi:DUF305 domain-containing protein [Salinibacterium sp. G-O1]|uniref:DUF305 domain-containing protein n=1 Tax=Salinibacterium sp. G-O1 TaxID=3046208 RepID=UPI0024B99C2D|nr:DUF305 domain-containing protein [Salinibacterium sp. G-O1]MDJ0334323.1 DUF305 domain-containing protein [Salinibacterium sp. G-O1]
MAPDSSPKPAVTADPGRSRRLAIAAVLTAIALVAVSLVIGRLSAPGDSDPVDSSAEAGFARDMQVHHNQAVEMAMIVRDVTADPDIRLLAYDIATSQAQQSGQMFGWLAQWGLPQAATDPSMTWMSLPPLGETSHDHAAETAHAPGSQMPGLATREQITELSASDSVAAERLFLELMIAHHAGGVEMAEAVVERSENRVVLDLAGSIVKAQSSEIELMTRMLADRE